MSDDIIPSYGLKFRIWKQTNLWWTISDMIYLWRWQINLPFIVEIYESVFLEGSHAHRIIIFKGFFPQSNDFFGCNNKKENINFCSQIHWKQKKKGTRIGSLINHHIGPIIPSTAFPRHCQQYEMACNSKVSLLFSFFGPPSVWIFKVYACFTFRDKQRRYPDLVTAPVFVVSIVFLVLKWRQAARRPFHPHVPMWSPPRPNCSIWCYISLVTSSPENEKQSRDAQYVDFRSQPIPSVVTYNSESFQPLLVVFPNKKQKRWRN